MTTLDRLALLEDQVDQARRALQGICVQRRWMTDDRSRQVIAERERQLAAAEARLREAKASWLAGVEVPA